ncbi:CaiF/GrlA family transcriptional regulator (plasmid) [Salmonella enterica]|uniref:CaiF/GrlA family transcriptional regulator n=1 Tax=Salmonella enterica TaxID=28901 RepID=UPI001EE86B94|nr:CaiF/GrlA family transcriptional regulator [Salmonella enterica]ULA45099.1 CaiF/GrlA family transcriptional regulator [Salmonella enterica]
MTLYSGDVSISDKQPGENMARGLKINPVIPECVADLKGYPLYIIVAYWGLRNNKTLTTTDVSRNFLITQQQSYDVLTYIYQEAQKQITATKRTLFNEHKRRISAFRILDIDKGILRTPKKEIAYASYDNIPTVTMKSTRCEIQDSFTELRRWMCSRKTGDRVEVFLNA